jgi:CBS domain-containing protein
MNASELMSLAVSSCGPGDSLQRAAQLMWEADCGAVPVVDGEHRVVGMITDRDVCMAAYTQGEALWRIPVSSAMARKVYGVAEGDSLDAVEAVMRQARVRRVPVLDKEGRLRGILSMNDLARHARGSVGRKADGLGADAIVKTLAAICAPHPVAPKADQAAIKPPRATA